MAGKEKPLFPPDETMWQKYSSHYEFPLASATSIFLHGMVIGLLAIGGIGFFFTADVEATKPPRMDVVMLEGEGAGGLEGLGGEAGLPGRPDGGGPGRKEFIDPILDQPDPPPLPRPTKDDLPELGLPILQDNGAPTRSDLVIELQKLRDAADRQSQSPTKTAPAPGTGEPKKTGPLGTGNPKGTGGLGGAGSGTGLGKAKGSGTGTGGFGGRKATDQEIFALRWSFDLSGDGREHARKLAAIGVNVGVIDPRGGFFTITDLNRRPVDLKKATLPNLKEVVGWQNQTPQSVQALARELQLPFAPRAVLLLLPKEREKKIANEEARFADEQGRALKTVRRTWFNFQLKNGAYEPVGIRFE